MKKIQFKEFNNPTIDEIEIIDRIKSGEKELYEILIRRNNQKLYRVIRSYIKSTQEIEDIMQNTYLKGYEKLYQFKKTSKFSTWLIRIGINEALMRIREKNKIHNLHNHSENFPLNSLLEIPDQQQTNPESRIIGDEAKKLLEYIVDSLDSKYKAVYIMKEIEGMPIKEIADCLNLSKSNVKVRLHRAKAMMKDKLNSITYRQEIFEFGNSRCDIMTHKVMSQLPILPAS